MEAVLGGLGSNMKRWSVRLLMLVAGAMLAAAVPGASVWADEHDDDDATGLEHACEKDPVSYQNPNCPESDKDRGGDDENNGQGWRGPGGGGGNGGGGNGGGGDNPPNAPGDDFQTRVAGCFEDANGDEDPDGCDTGDNDEDLVPNQFDNCAGRDNTTQWDNDGDGIGNRCDPYADDADHDGVNDDVDNCPDDPNPSQKNSDGNVNGGDDNGDACDSDMGNNRVPDSYDDEYALVYENTIGQLPSPAG